MNVSAAGTTTLSAISKDTMVKCNNAGAATLNISAGANVPGKRLVISEVDTTGITIQTGTGLTAVLGVGSIVLAWDGTAWHKIGGAPITVVFTSGSATFRCPFTGKYKAICTGGGGAGGSAITSVTGGGGGGGATAIRFYWEIAGAALSYSIGAGGAGDAGANGGSGSNSWVTDGSVQIIGGGAGGGKKAIGGNFGLGNSGQAAASGGHINIPGGNGRPGHIGSDGASAVMGCANGGASMFGGGAVGPMTNSSVAGTAGAANTGEGGSGATNSAIYAGGNGGSGVVVIEF